MPMDEYNELIDGIIKLDTDFDTRYRFAMLANKYIRTHGGITDDDEQ